MKFKYKLMTTFLSISILSILMFTLFQYKSSAKYILTLEQESLLRQSQIIRRHIDLYIETQSKQVKTIITNSKIEAFLEGEIDREGVNSLFNNIKNINPDEYSVLFLLDKNGVCRASTDRRFIDTDYSFRPYYSKIVKNKLDLYISDYSIGLKSLIPGMFISAPVLDGENNLLGVFIIKISGEYFQSLIEGINNLNLERDSSKSPEAFIINSDGVIIMHPNKEFLYKSLTPLDNKTKKRIKEERQFLDRDILSLDEDVLGRKHLESLANDIDLTTVYNSSRDSVLNIVALSPMNINNWTVGVTMNYSDFSSFSQDFLFRTNIFMLLVFIAIVISALILSRYISQPVDKMLIVLKDAVNHNWSVRLSERTKDEFGDLARKFNHLLEIIENYSIDMEEKVEQRTEKVLLLQKENNRLSIIKEREKLYRDIHDSIGAKITNINICNQVAQSSLEKDNKKVKEMLQRIEDNCNWGIKDMKKLISNEVSILENTSPFPYNLLNRIEKRLELKKIIYKQIVENVQDLRSISDNDKYEIEKILQEIVSNILKHSFAKWVGIKLVYNDNILEISIIDDGIGFILDNYSSGFGLNSIKKRVQLLAGEIDIETELNIGCRYNITIPISRDN